ncbi:MAG: hypothetical protein P4N59_01325 [Negativicutes bacterium]|nr:hypothetical protein [Negativicutes bacterium]
MYHKLAASCVDINTAYCPCLLAETNHCIACSHLRGEPLCDCNWSGVCILGEKQWQSKVRNGSIAPVTERSEIIAKLMRKEEITKNVYLLELSVSEEMGRELQKTGAFVFLRRQDDPQYFHFPVGVMKAKDTSIQVVVEAVGPKSVRLLEPGIQEMIVRGPYYNGVLGQPWIDNITCGTILLIAGGMGQPPALPLAAKLVARNKVTAVLAPGKIGKVFIEQDLKDMGVDVHLVDSMRRNGLGLFGRCLEKDSLPDLVVSAGPDEQHYAVIAAMQAANVNLPMAATNNATMCCGEGICGSCLCETQDNRQIKLCKAQTDFGQLVT